MKNTNKTKKPTVNYGSLNPEAIYTATGKVARASHNAERHV